VVNQESGLSTNDQDEPIYGDEYVDDVIYDDDESNFKNILSTGNIFEE